MITGQMGSNSSLETVGVNIKSKSILYDASRCTACRGCQGACKQWHDLPAERTKNVGSYQNPMELSPKTWLIIRFDERLDSKGYPVWLFNRQSCFHCDNPDCSAVCPTGAMSVRSDGVVFVNRELCIGCENCATACPFGVPQIDKESEKSFKCDFCVDRIDNGLAPACVSTCPSGALTYGEREELLKEAKKRVAQLKARGFTEANVYGITSDFSTHVILVLPFSPERYSWIPKKPQHTQEVVWWKEIFSPLGAIAIGASALAAIFHYVTIGPKRVEEALTSQDEEK